MDPVHVGGHLHEQDYKILVPRTDGRDTRRLEKKTETKKKRVIKRQENDIDRKLKN
jgi:hypothetical protein